MQSQIIYRWIVDSLNQSSHVAKTVLACYSVLHQLRTIRQSVSKSVLQSLVLSLVLSRLAIRHSPAFHQISCHGCSQSRSAHLFLVKVPAHHSAVSAALAQSSRADCIQTISPRVQGLHGSAPAYLTDELYQVTDVEARQRLRSSSIFIIDCQPHPTPYCRWPSFPGRRCTCLEQSAWSCHFRTFCSSLPVLA